MKLFFQGWDEEFVHGVKELEAQLGFQMDPSGLPVEVVRLSPDAGQLRVTLSGGKGRIEYVEKIHFFRALGLFVEHAKTKESFDLTERPSFDYNGAMLDASRNAVMRVDAIKQMLRYMAVMGLNGLMMYTEDTYEVPELPYFGYMRGRYTAEELRECDDYAVFVWHRNDPVHSDAGAFISCAEMAVRRAAARPSGHRAAGLASHV